jgi:hypothetical protein
MLTVKIIKVFFSSNQSPKKYLLFNISKKQIIFNEQKRKFLVFTAKKIM